MKNIVLEIATLLAKEDFAQRGIDVEKDDFNVEDFTNKILEIAGIIERNFIEG